MPPERRKIVGVFGANENGLKGYDGELRKEICQLAHNLGRWLATKKFHLLTGGGQGLMAAVCEGFFNSPREGTSIGIIPAGPPAGYPNQWIDIPIYTPLNAGPERRFQSGDGSEIVIPSRNEINSMSVDLAVVLFGKAGTTQEAILALEYNKPVVLLKSIAVGGKMFENTADIPPAQKAKMKIATSLSQLKAVISESLEVAA